MSRLIRVMTVFASLLGILLVVGFVLPSKVHVERSITINAQPRKIYPLISNFHAWEKWSPWAKLDPDAKYKITGRGAKQKMIWSSNNPSVGSGWQKFTALDAPKKIKTHLDFGKQGMADASFDLVAKEGATQVTWALDTDSRAGVPIYMQPLSTYFGLMLDSMVGKDYEQGLKNLQSIVEQ